MKQTRDSRKLGEKHFGEEGRGAQSGYGGRGFKPYKQVVVREQ